MGVLVTAPLDFTSSTLTGSVKFVPSNNISSVITDFQNALLVHNPNTQKIESLMNPNLAIAFEPIHGNPNDNSIGAVGIASQSTFNLGSYKIIIISDPAGSGSQIITSTAFYTTYGLIIDDSLNMGSCLWYKNAENYWEWECWQKLVTVVNYVSLPSESVVISDNSNLCCYTGGSLVEFILNLTVPFDVTKYANYSSLDDCQKGDKYCTCPSNTTCWLYNGVNVPCCIQANPSDDRFKVNKILNTKITQSPTDCQAEATTCVNWRFNTKDVPCCIQRSTDQWNTMGYDLATTQQYSTEELCRTANTNCTFYTLLHPAKLKTTDFNNLIFESKFTSGCETLRDANVSNPFGSSLDCTKDVNKTECISGNCGKNFCDAWSPSSVTPVNAYSFTQNVNCLPESSVCTGNKTLNVTNAGKWNVSSICQ